MVLADWGDTAVQETSTDKLQETVLPIVPSSNCIERMNEIEDVDENLIVCGGGAAEGPCKVGHQKLSSVLSLTQGDSGGPLTVVNEEDNHVLVGIVSKRLGSECSQQDFAVFTSVSAHLPWIESSIQENGGMASCGSTFSAPPSLGIYRHKINE